MTLTPAHKAIAVKLGDARRLQRVLDAIKHKHPLWLAGFNEPEELILETLKIMGKV
jgi:hypothetical protein